MHLYTHTLPYGSYRILVLEALYTHTEFIWFITLYGVYGCNECKSTKKHRITDYSSN